MTPNAVAAGLVTVASAPDATAFEAGSSALASPKSSTFTVPSGRSLILAGFRSRWTMPLLVRGFQGLGNLVGDAQGLVDRQGPAHPFRERNALDEFQDEHRRRPESSTP